MAAPPVHFLDYLVRNKLVLKDVNISVNWMKSTFLCDLWSWVNLYSVERLRSLVDFFDLGGL